MLTLHTFEMTGDVLDSEDEGIDDSDGEMGGSEGRRHHMEVEDESIHSFEGHSGECQGHSGGLEYQMLAVASPRQLCLSDTVLCHSTVSGSCAHTRVMVDTCCLSGANNTAG
jgi:hypothetical protein